jgi:hypothetical protein
VDLLSPSPDLTVRPTVGEDVFDLAPRLRQDDVQEILDMTGMDPLAALGSAYVESARCFTVVYKGRVTALMGVVESQHCTDPRLGIVWMLGSDDVSLFGFSMTKYARAWLRELCAGFDVVGNLISECNVMHVRFLKRLGARIVKGYENYGPGQVTALEFVFTSEELQEPPIV